MTIVTISTTNAKVSLLRPLVAQDTLADTYIAYNIKYIITNNFCTSIRQWRVIGDLQNNQLLIITEMFSCSSKKHLTLLVASFQLMRLNNQKEISYTSLFNPFHLDYLLITTRI